MSRRTTETMSRLEHVKRDEKRILSIVKASFKKMTDEEFILSFQVNAFNTGQASGKHGMPSEIDAHIMNMYIAELRRRLRSKGTK